MAMYDAGQRITNAFVQALAREDEVDADAEVEEDPFYKEADAEQDSPPNSASPAARRNGMLSIRRDDQSSKDKAAKKVVHPDHVHTQKHTHDHHSLSGSESGGEDDNQNAENAEQVDLPFMATISRLSVKHIPHVAAREREQEPDEELPELLAIDDQSLESFTDKARARTLGDDEVFTRFETWFIKQFGLDTGC